MKPSNVDTGRVVGRFIVDVIDGVDEDDEPDFIAATGFIEFTASVTHLPNPTAEPAPVTILRSTIMGILDDEGYLCTPDPTDPRKSGRRGVRLVANDDPDLLVQNWTWKVRYRFGNVAGVALTLESHDIDLGANETKDLTTAVHVPSSPGIGVPQIEATALRAEAAAKGVVDRANAGEFKGDTGPATDLSIGIMEFIPGSSIDSEVVDAQLSTAGTVANIALIAEAKRAVLANAGSVLASNFKLGTVTTNPAGSSATASLTGTAPERTLHLGLPKGDPGGWVVSHLGPGADLNALIAPGVYSVGSSSYAKVANGFPIEAVCYVEVLSSGTTHVQRVTVAGGGSSMKVQYERRNNGSAWESWRTFSSTRVDNTAGRAIYQWDDTANREQRIYGDTGWRSLGTIIHANVSAGELKIRRIDSTVEVSLDGITLSNATPPLNIHNPGGFALGAGFTPQTTLSRTVLTAGDTDLTFFDNYIPYVAGQTLYLRLMSRQTSSGFTPGPLTSVKPAGGSITWTTRDPWPTSLPGTAVGAIPNL